MLSYDDLVTFIEEKEVLFASEAKRNGKPLRLYVKLDGTFKVFHDGVTLYHGDDPGEAIKVFNEVPNVVEPTEVK